MSDWDDTAGLFSPSVARQQQVQDQEWRYVLDWLAPLYHPKPVPAFERNAETLASLLALANVNEAADEEKSLRLQLEKEALEYYKNQEEEEKKEEEGALSRNTETVEILRDIETHLSPQASEALDAIAETCESIGVDNTASTSSIAKSIVQVRNMRADVDRHLLNADQLLSRLSTTLSSLRSAKDTYSADDYKAPSTLPAQLAEWTRTAKVLQQKAAEYKDKTRILEQMHKSKIEGKPTIDDLIKAEEQINSIREDVEDLEGQVMGFKGLPSNRELAELEVEGFRRELLTLEKEREDLYGNVLKVS